MTRTLDKTVLPLRRSLHRVRGFSLLGTMVGTLIAGVVAVGGSMLYGDYKQDQVAQGRGIQLGSALAQLDSFARRFQGQLTAGQAIAGVANTSAPTAAELQALGFVAAGFADATQPGGRLEFRIAREPAGCAPAECILSLTAVTGGSVALKGVADAAFAQKIAGYVPDGAGWSNLADDAAKLGKNGRTIPNPRGGTPAVVAAVAWLGNNQASQTVPPVSFNFRTLSCGSGYTGTREQQQSVTTDKWGTITTGSWTTYANDCAALPPPTCANGATDYPTCTPPTCSNGGTNYPTCTPPTCSNGATNYPTCTLSCANGATNYPTCTFSCENGATNYPTCTFSCANGATNYPTCTFSCANGATNYPTCTFSCANGATNYPACTLPEPAGCPEDQYRCEPFKPEFFKFYRVTYGPPPTCKETKTLIDMGAEGVCTY